MKEDLYQALQQYLARSLLPEQKRELLDTSGWGREFDTQQMNTLPRYLDAYELPNNHRVFLEDSQEAYLAIVVKGKVKILKKDASSDAKEIATIQRGSAFGEISIIDGAPRSGTAITQEPTILLLLTKSKFDLITREDPKLGVALTLKIARLLAQRLRRTTGRLVEYLED